MGISIFGDTFPGQFTSEIFAATAKNRSLLLRQQDAGGFGATVLNGYKSKYIFHRADTYARPYVSGTDFVTSFLDGQNSEIDLGLREGSMCDLAVTMFVPLNVWVGRWGQESLAAGANAESPEQIETWSVIVAHFVESIADQLDNLLLRGSIKLKNGQTSTTQICEGLLAKFEADLPAAQLLTADADILVSTPSATPNVYSELRRIMDALPKQLYYNSDRPLAFAVSPEIAFAWETYQGLANTTGGNTPGVLDGGINRIASRPMAVLGNLAPTEAFFGDPEQVAVFFDREEDSAEIRIINQNDTGIKRGILMDCRWRQAIDFGSADSLVYYRP